ncbi:hypothetical protein DT603_10805 [Pseudoxanthomonas gei]|uniref:PAAR motif-containing protein n=1 Tax=Pseudoxanthomonas gei TaxID=1383030 RepID=A0ABX0AGG7_9GAMM|nr:hypothetical protein [Pseudoxanthomonas gei]NDK39331.1 hypothetical protein [Pseudoxanthomonas gei]
MGNPVLTAASTLLCAHGMPAMSIAGNARVKVSGSPVLCVGDTVLVHPCNDTSPCLTLRLQGSARVRASGRPVAIATAVVSHANGLAALIAATQQRVWAG